MVSAPLHGTEHIYSNCTWNHPFFEQYIRINIQNGAGNIDECRYCYEPCSHIFSSGCRCLTPVHQVCFNRWISVSQRIACEICGSRFRLMAL